MVFGASIEALFLKNCGETILLTGTIPLSPQTIFLPLFVQARQKQFRVGPAEIGYM